MEVFAGDVEHCHFVAATILSTSAPSCWQTVSQAFVASVSEHSSAVEPVLQPALERHDRLKEVKTIANQTRV